MWQRKEASSCCKLIERRAKGRRITAVKGSGSCLGIKRAASGCLDGAQSKQQGLRSLNRDAAKAGGKCEWMQHMMQNRF